MENPGYLVKNDEKQIYVLGVKDVYNESKMKYEYQ